MTYRYLTLMLLMAVGARTTNAMAGTVSLERTVLDEGNVVALLESTSQYHVDAMREVVMGRHPSGHHLSRWESLEVAMRDAPVARMEYRYELDGIPQTRVYHAFAGQPLSATADAIFTGESPVSTPPLMDSGDFTGESPEPGPSNRSVIHGLDLIDEQDDIYFADLPEGNVRARVLPPEGSVLTPFDVEGAQGALDAEFKAMRAIERDIAEGLVPRGGRIVGMIGGSACASCQHVMERMAETYDVDIRVTQVFGNLPPSRQRALIASGGARFKGPLLVDSQSGRPILAKDVLAESRQAQVRQALTPRAMESARHTPWIRRSFRLGPHPKETGRTGDGSARSSRHPSGDTEQHISREC
ncbi:hypothetical protein L2Y94_19160 [Luteibacter aegosomatis]|uniref:hypothetical protein n=1 Tax=Luteibacter aegosomatis TaxID=2911537 RepID=UPI001FF9ED89|nr:hypothetical protein [Luteibacter aegosomatis]UPG85398.1 hypothetical protein L2Y94_19160 [Luteibacter aegosomatis]